MSSELGIAAALTLAGLVLMIGAGWRKLSEWRRKRAIVRRMAE
jgi:hypothetical protein